MDFIVSKKLKMKISGYNSLRPPNKLKRHILAGLFILTFIVGAALGEVITLTLYPAKIAEQNQAYRLLPSANEVTDTDAFPLYEKAFQSMPKGVNTKQIKEWLKLPIEQFPQTKAEGMVHKHIESMRYAIQAARCKECNWPELKPETEMKDLSVYRELIYLIQLRTRLEISRGQYEDALVTMQMAFGMAKHLGQAPTIIQTLVGAAAGGIICKEVEQFVQAKDSPNLYAALANLPEPLVNVEKAIQNERANLKKYNVLVRKQMEKQLDPVHDRVRLIANRLDNHVNALQVVETIRHYAATHDGQSPQSLSDIKDTAVPNDLISNKAFEYSRTDTGATLNSAIPEGGNERDAVHYEIILKK